MLPILLMLAGTDDLMAAHREKTAAERRCAVDPNSTDITVCGLRSADRYRVAFVGGTNENQVDNVPYERDAMLHRTNPVSDLSPFLVGGGMVGVTVSSHGGVGGVGGYKVREQAK